MRVLVVGGDGELGGALAAALPAKGVTVASTTRRSERAAGRILVDLAAPPATWPPLPETDAAVICAAASRVETCRRDPVGSRRVNVDGTVALVRRLPRRCFTLFLSTNHVLDGSEPRQRAESPRNPSSAYGEQKAEAEERLLALDRDIGVLRLAKVLTPLDPLLVEWRRQLRIGVAIAPFADVVNAPAPVDFVCDLIACILARRATGIIQASGDRDLSYADMARVFARTLGFDPARLVRPTMARQPGTAFVSYPRFASLDGTRATALLGRSLPDSIETVRRVSRTLAAGE
jgi:dTDP-4-dehydrorhamnose reductase